MHRRQFLDPRRLTPIAGPILGAMDETVADPSSEPVQLRFARQAMATTFEVIVPFETPSAHEIAPSVLDEIDRLESQLTVYRSTSEVSQLNERAHRQPTFVSKSLFDLLSQALRLHDETDGAFDIAIGGLIKSWGFHRRAGQIPPEAERQWAHERSGSRFIQLDAQRQTVFFTKPGVEINLGSIGKGFAIDQAATRLRPSVRDFLMHGGHSSILAAGNEAPGRVGWQVGITDPRDSGRRRAVLRLRNRAMATSAATFQFFEHEGRTLGHILDPRSGWPAEGILSATVTAPSAAEADALATAFFILGVERTRAYCTTRPHLGAILITNAEPERLVDFGQAKAEIVKVL